MLSNFCKVHDDPEKVNEAYIAIDDERIRKCVLGFGKDAVMKLSYNLEYTPEL